MTVEEKFAQTDFSQFSRIKDALLFRLKLRRYELNIERNEELSMEELDRLAAAGNPNIKKPTQPPN